MRMIILAILSIALVYPSTIIRVKDADTFVMQIEIWPKLTLEKDVRLYCVDAWETTRRREIRIGNIRYRANEQ